MYTGEQIKNNWNAIRESNALTPDQLRTKLIELRGMLQRKEHSQALQLSHELVDLICDFGIKTNK